MSWNVQGKVGLITGASSALGREVTRRLALQHGLRIACVSRRSTIEALPDNCTSFQADVTKSTECDALLKAVRQDLGPVAIVVSCAGTTLNKLHVRTTDEDYNFIMDTNLRGALNISRSALRYGGMVQLGDGSMLFTGSAVGESGNEGQVLYGASKAALGGAVRCLAKEYGAKNIRFNVVAPGLIEGPGMGTTLTDAQRAQWRQLTALKRLATVGDVADVIVSTLLSTYVTGKTIIVDGGV